MVEKIVVKKKGIHRRVRESTNAHYDGCEYLTERGHALHNAHARNCIQEINEEW